MRKHLPYLTLIFCLVLSACNTPAAIKGETSTPTTLGKESAESTATLRPTAGPTPTPQPEVALTDKDIQGIRVNFLHPWNGETASVVDALINEFNQTNSWKIFVTANAAGSQSAVDAALRGSAVENLPDLLAAPAVDLNTWQDAGIALVNLQPYVDSAQWGLSSTAIDPVFWAQDITNNLRLGLPIQRSASVIFYNQSWGQELGFANPPDSLDEFEQVICAAAETLRADAISANDGTGGYIVNIDQNVVLSWLTAFGGGVLPAESSGDYTFNSVENTQAITTMRQWYDQGCSWVGRNPQPHEYFANRQAIAYAGTLQDALLQIQTNQRLASTDQCVMLPFPANSKPVLMVSGPSLAIVKKSLPQQLAAWVFARWLADPARQARLAKASGTFTIAGEPPAGLLIDSSGDYSSAPTFASWQVGGPVLSDVMWWALQPQVAADAAGDILKEADATLSELLVK